MLAALAGISDCFPDDARRDQPPVVCPSVAVEADRHEGQGRHDEVCGGGGGGGGP